MFIFSLDAGYRNTGLTIGKAGKIVLAVRSTHGLEVPLTDSSGRLLVDESYIRFVTEQANTKLLDNENRIKKYEEICKDRIFHSLVKSNIQNVKAFGTLQDEGEKAKVSD